MGTIAEDMDEVRTVRVDPYGAMRDGQLVNAERRRRADDREYTGCTACNAIGCAECDGTGWGLTQAAIESANAAGHTTTLTPREHRPRRAGRWSGDITTTQNVLDLDGLVTAMVGVINRDHSDLAELARLLYTAGDGSAVDGALRTAIIHALHMETTK